MNLTIGDKQVGPGQPVFIIAEIGINHNGSLATALQLVDAAKNAGADMVKFQKRTVEVVYSAEEMARPRESPFGHTNGDLKRGLEFGLADYIQIDRYCREKGILWTASPWDEESVDFLAQFNPPAYKVASACLTDDSLLARIARHAKPIILSTGMSTLDEINHAVSTLWVSACPTALLHCTATYPCAPNELNLTAIPRLAAQFTHLPVGFSSHAVSPEPAIIAAALGACIIEAHITLDRSMWGSDQAASLEPTGFGWMVKHIRSLERIMGDGEKRVYDSEVPVMRKLRRVGLMV